MNGRSRQHLRVGALVVLAGRFGVCNVASLLCFLLRAGASPHDPSPINATPPELTPQPIAWHVLVSIDPVEHVTLFQCYANDTHRAPPSSKHVESIRRHDDRMGCCRAIQRSADAFVLATNETRSSTLMEEILASLRCDSHEAGSRVSRFLARVPVADDTAITIRVPSFAMIHSAGATSPARPNETERGVLTEGADGDTWTHFLWDDSQRRVVMDWANDDHRDELRDWLTSANSNWAGAGYSGKFRASLQSQLSESGGMHRSLRIGIHVDIPPEAKPEAGAWDLEMRALMHLPSGVFVNVHDAFEHSSDARTNLRLQLITVKGEIIDEEQPEFVSPSHAILLRIQATLSQLHKGDAWQCAFDMKLHARYPQTIVAPADNFFSRLVVLSPSLVSGTLRSGDESEAYLWTPSTPSVSGLTAVPQLHGTWISAGKQADAQWVNALTLLALSVGTLVMWRDISKLVTWE